MARKWSNLNLPGALHFVTGNFLERTPVFTEPACCSAFLEELRCLNQKWPSKLIAYVVMPDHFHLISNPRDGRIKEFVGGLKSLSAKSIVRVCKQFLLNDSLLQRFALPKWLAMILPAILCVSCGQQAQREKTLESPQPAAVAKNPLEW